ncbi:MAG: NADH-quinone oxidoreductase subunit NuoK [Planctomycetes bacterium]|nr:NADH-quinone oxidoreductase subunit NuoK [Planctomycetota bacterium]
MTTFSVQILAAILFSFGLATSLSRRNLFFVLMGVELMLNAVNLSFVGFSQSLEAAQGIIGQVAPLFIVALAAAEACIGLAMLICLVRRGGSLDVDTYSELKE